MLIRPATVDDVPAMARLHIDSWRETYVGIVPQSYLDSLEYAVREKRWVEIMSRQTSRDHILVGVDEGGQLVGLVAGGAGPDEGFREWGEVYAIYLLKSAQGGGWGRRLLEKSFGMLRERRFESVYLWVLRDNPTRGFYARMKGRETGTKVIEIGGVPLTELRVEWDADRLKGIQEISGSTPRTSSK
jgi:ribosomal protein S18 acetylase RimI-like enzyme